MLQCTWGPLLVVAGVLGDLVVVVVGVLGDGANAEALGGVRTHVKLHVHVVATSKRRNESLFG